DCRPAVRPEENGATRSIKCEENRCAASCGDCLIKSGGYSTMTGPRQLRTTTRMFAREDVMQINRRNIIRGAAAAGLAIPAGVFLPRWAAADDIAVGSILDATGPINIYGKPMIDATKFAVDSLNQADGVLGRKLRLIENDGQSNNQVYAQDAVKLILDDKVAALMCGITSASRAVVRPVVVI